MCGTCVVLDVQCDVRCGISHVACGVACGVQGAVCWAHRAVRMVVVHGAARVRGISGVVGSVECNVHGVWCVVHGMAWCNICCKMIPKMSFLMSSNCCCTAYTTFRTSGVMTEELLGVVKEMIKTASGDVETVPYGQYLRTFCRSLWAGPRVIVHSASKSYSVYCRAKPLSKPQYTTPTTSVTKRGNWYFLAISPATFAAGTIEG